jgi:hypothetical protein
VLAVVGGLVLLGSRLQPPSRGEQYQDALTSALSPPPAPVRPRMDLPNYVQEPEASKRHAEALVVKSGGDFSRLAPEEQRWLNALTAGHGAEMVRKRAASLRAQAEKERAAARRRE